MNPEKSKGYMAGGMKLKGPNGKIRSANITFDEEQELESSVKLILRKQ